jgi:hypothetical protein
MMAFDHRRVSLQSGCIREPGAGVVRVFHQDALDAKLPPSLPDCGSAKFQCREQISSNQCCRFQPTSLTLTA